METNSEERRIQVGDYIYGNLTYLYEDGTIKKESLGFVLIDRKKGISLSLGKRLSNPFEQEPQIDCLIMYTDSPLGSQVLGSFVGVTINMNQILELNNMKIDNDKRITNAIYKIISASPYHIENNKVKK